MTIRKLFSFLVLSLLVSQHALALDCHTHSESDHSHLSATEHCHDHNEDKANQFKTTEDDDSKADDNTDCCEGCHSHHLYALAHSEIKGKPYILFEMSQSFVNRPLNDFFDEVDRPPIF